MCQGNQPSVTRVESCGFVGGVLVALARQEEVAVMVKSTVAIMHSLGELPTIPRPDVMAYAIDEMFRVADADGSGMMAWVQYPPADGAH